MNQHHYSTVSPDQLNKLAIKPRPIRNAFILERHTEKSFLERYEEATKDGRATPFVVQKLGPTDYVVSGD